MGDQISVRNPYTVEVVSLCWRAPELLLQEKLQKARKKGLYNTKLDLWAAGCIMAEMLRSGRPILPGTSEIDQLMKILRLCGTPEESDWDRLLTSNFTSDSCQILRNFQRCERSIHKAFSDYPKDMVDLLDKILVIDPSKRISLEEAREHKFFKGGYNVNAMYVLTATSITMCWTVSICGQRMKMTGRRKAEELDRRRKNMKRSVQMQL